jgi:DNA (cytosine-5)-methyltransferase 1
LIYIIVHDGNYKAIHASPPCQFGTELNSDRSRHVNLIPHTRRLCEATGLPYVIENVRAVAKAGHLVNPVSLDGTMFGNHCITSKGQRFDLLRERCFEANWPLKPASTSGLFFFPLANVYGGHLRARSGPYRTGKGTGRTVDFEGEDRPALARQLMGMPWATMQGMSEAVPPAYTRWIGKQLMEVLR